VSVDIWLSRQSLYRLQTKGKELKNKW